MLGRDPVKKKKSNISGYVIRLESELGIRLKKKHGMLQGESETEWHFHRWKVKKKQKGDFGHNSPSSVFLSIAFPPHQRTPNSVDLVALCL